MNILCHLLILAVGTLFYIKGETDTKWLGKCNKNWKYFVGFPVGALGCLITHNWTTIIWTAAMYFALGECLPYGSSSPWRKLLGDRWAVTLNGFGLGLSCVFIIGWWALLQAVIAGATFYILNKQQASEPRCAITRGIMAFLIA